MTRSRLIDDERELGHPTYENSSADTELRVIFLSEASQRVPLPASQKDTNTISEIARLNGCRVLEFPANFEEQGLGFDDIFSYIPNFGEPQIAYYNGFIPSADRYGSVFEACLQKNIHLLNSPKESIRALTFEHWYPALEEMTPRSAIVQDVGAVAAAVAHIGLPVFVKGSVKSLKHKGISSCVATSCDAAEALTSELLGSDFRSRGKVILRKWEVLRHVRTSDLGLPLGREYRVFVYKANILAMGYYWEGTDELAALSESEATLVSNVALSAAKMLGTPYVIIDVGQREDGEWIVIEAGDAQFAGLSHVDPLPLLAKLIQLAAVE